MVRDLEVVVLNGILHRQMAMKNQDHHRATGPLPFAPFVV
jgi:hypothetical protein